MTGIIFSNITIEVNVEMLILIVDYWTYNVSNILHWYGNESYGVMKRKVNRKDNLHTYIHKTYSGEQYSSSIV